MEKSGVVKLRYQSIHKTFSTRINILVNRSLKNRSVSRTMNFLQRAGCHMHEHQGSKKNYVQIGHYCAQSSCMCSILFFPILRAH